jgi:hypothetical protein
VKMERFIRRLPNEIRVKLLYDLRFYSEHLLVLSSWPAFRPFIYTERIDCSPCNLCPFALPHRYEKCSATVKHLFRPSVYYKLPTFPFTNEQWDKLLKDNTE